MTKVCINYRSYTDVCAENHFGGDFYGEDTYTSHDIESIYEVGEKAYFDLTVNFDIVEGETYYLLYGIYSTGDSFNNHEGCIQFVDLYQTEEFAEANKEILEKHNAAKDGSYTAKLLLENGKEYPFHVPWKGYFEVLNEVFIIPITAVTK